MHPAKAGVISKYYKIKGNTMLNKTENYKIVAVKGTTSLTKHLYVMLPLKCNWFSILDYTRLQLSAYSAGTARKCFWEKK